MVSASVPNKLRISPKNKRHCAEKNEGEQIETIIRYLKEKTPEGVIMENQFFKQFNRKIFDARKRKGNINEYKGKRDGWDLELNIGSTKNTAQWKKVEAKSSKDPKKRQWCIKNIQSPDLHPWKIGVQFKNDHLQHYTFESDYLKKYYSKFIESEIIRKLYKIDEKFETPNFKDWKKDMLKTGNYKTTFMKEYKRKHKLNGQKIKKELDPIRKKFHSEYTIPDEDNFKKEIIDTCKKAFNNKDYWLNICGWEGNACLSKIKPHNTNSPINSNTTTVFRWFDGSFYKDLFKNISHNDLEIKKKKSVNLVREINIKNLNFKFEVQTHFKNQVSNISLDFK
tara:strand:+ start:3019 stop:4032 length:1014 start_codon:yes stop_codon:yes gene_type:complete